jgi:magnesium transporter
MLYRSKYRRAKARIGRRNKPGEKPGTFTVAADAKPTVVRVMAYGRDKCIEKTVEDLDELKTLLEQLPMVWVDVVGLGSEDKLRKLAEIFKMHPLALEDVVYVHQRAKVDAYDEDLYIVLRMPDPTHEQLTEQFSLLLGKNYLVTFQERPGDSFELVRAGVRQEQSAARKSLQPDYLAYRLIDAAIDAYFPVIEKIGDHLDELDDPSSMANTHKAFTELHCVRRELLTLRRSIWPIRDAISELRADTTPFISNSTRVYLRDCYDHAVQLIDLMESYRDIAGDVRDFYLSTISNRMNEVMKTLTLIATIFLPLTFIAGVYGMNFDPHVSPWNMPELEWKYGYLFVWALMLIVAAGMIWYFQHKGWLKGTFREGNAAEPESEHQHDEP